MATTPAKKQTKSRPSQSTKRTGTASRGTAAAKPKKGGTSAGIQAGTKKSDHPITKAWKAGVLAAAKHIERIGQHGGSSTAEFFGQHARELLLDPPPLDPTPTPCDCDSIPLCPTGVAGIPYRDGAGVWHILCGVLGGKNVKLDLEEAYLSAE